MSKFNMSVSNDTGVRAPTTSGWGWNGMSYYSSLKVPLQ